MQHVAHVPNVFIGMFMHAVPHVRLRRVKSLNREIRKLHTFPTERTRYDRIANHYHHCVYGPPYARGSGLTQCRIIITSGLSVNNSTHGRLVF